MKVTKEQIIQQIISLEWKMMVSITAIDDPEKCREDPATFQIMRTSQHLVWNEDTLASFLADLQLAESRHVNMVAERYAHMMKVTNPSEYEQIKDDLQPVSAEAAELVEKVMKILSVWTAEVDLRYPNIRSFGRPATENGTWTAVDTYLRGEFLTYSAKTLTLCLRDISMAQACSINLSETMLLNMARFYGFQSLEDMEKKIADTVQFQTK